MKKKYCSLIVFGVIFIILIGVIGGSCLIEGEIWFFDVNIVDGKIKVEIKKVGIGEIIEKIGHYLELIGRAHFY
ncbi:MAG: hypothetical protein A2V69_01845 [Candidatus Portnoybacteria bacterium RBG_13_40_8]|uniref:Uncharacterized protein n=1 Tax=Candidatus Portnoybacteria bacterium RBG_13_40_8 TaxID=1801990 RepID=A0A1G2F696_9BACT|nr:MAG: hypothetical protein A2V69_01845 [Candidatus Portnoybacteria bacterium RBG_13_40_8]